MHSSRFIRWFSWTCLLSQMVLATTVHARTLPELVDATEAAAPAPNLTFVSTSDAKADLQALKAHIEANYAYKDYYEKRWNFHLDDLITLKLSEVDALSKEGQISINDFRALVSEVVSKFRDAHEWISSKGNSSLSLNIGLTFGEAEREYLMYKGNAEIYSQLGLQNLSEFENGQYVLRALNGIAMNRVESALIGVLPYSNSLTRHSYAGILLSSSKGLLYLSTLMKRGKFPMSQDVIELTLQSKKTGEIKKVAVHPQAMAPWSTEDLVGKLEGRSSDILPSEETPEAYAKAYGWRFDEVKPGTFVFTSPSWAGDLVHPKNTINSRRMLYQYVLNCMKKISEADRSKQNANQRSELIFDVRGNRGGDVILWQPIIQLLMKNRAEVTGLIQLNDEAMKVYSTYRNLSTEESISAADHRDYLNYAYANSDQDLDADVRSAVDRERSHLSQTGLLKDDRIDQDARFSKLLYVTTEKKEAGDFNGKVSVLADRYSFSANDTFLAALRSVVPPDRLTVYGEKPEGGSGTGGHLNLANSKLSVPVGTFASFNVNGQMFETDFEKPEVRMVLPLSEYFQRTRWSLDFVLEDISSGRRDRRILERRADRQSEQGPRERSSNAARNSKTTGGSGPQMGQLQDRSRAIACESLF